MVTYQEFSRQIKEKYPEYKDVDDLKLANAMIEKYPQYKNQVTFDDIEEQPQEPIKAGVGVDITPSGLFKGSQNVVASALTAPIVAKRDNISVKDAFNQNMDKVREWRKENPTPFQDFAVDTAGYTGLSLIPGLEPVAAAKNAGTAARLGNFALNAAKVGAIPGALEGLKNGIGSAGLGALGGSAIAGGIMAGVPVVGNVAKQAGKLIPYTGNSIAKTLGRLNPKTLEIATKPGSKALDLTPEEAQNLLMNTTEGVRADYNQLLTDKGNQVGRLLADLPENQSFKAGDILQDYDKIYNNYSLSKNDLLNPARNATSKELEKIKDLVYGDTSGNLQKFKNQMDELKYPVGRLEVQRGKKQGGKYWSHTLENVNNDITIANRRFNDEILGTLKQNPDWTNDPKKIEALEKHIANYSVPEEYALELYNKFYEAIGKGDVLNKANNLVTPKELYDINKNVSNMVDWNKADSALKNEVLEQIYGSNAEKIANLSPELKEANKAYSDLMDFQKNEGIRRILNNSNNIDTASSALKNYNSTVTKGNTNRNIQDLEKKLVDNGYGKFLNDIDDVNAAMDLNNIRTTGDSFWANVGTQLARPILRGARAYNSSNLPVLLQNIGNVAGNVARRVLPAAFISMPPLQAGVTYNEYN